MNIFREALPLIPTVDGSSGRLSSGTHSAKRVAGVPLVIGGCPRVFTMLTAMLFPTAGRSVREHAGRDTRLVPVVKKPRGRRWGADQRMDVEQFQLVLLHTFSRDQAERAQAESRLEALKVACIWDTLPEAPLLLRVLTSHHPQMTNRCYGRRGYCLALAIDHHHVVCRRRQAVPGFHLLLLHTITQPLPREIRQAAAIALKVSRLLCCVIITSRTHTRVHVRPRVCRTRRSRRGSWRSGAWPRASPWRHRPSGRRTRCVCV
jgi:hypothetical protein